MMRENPCEQTTFGYLATLESAEHGVFGGYLLISPQGRPREFHCTAPVRPSRAQRILYGPTFEAYLLGEQIGGTLLASSKLRPQLVITNQLNVLSLRSQIEFPLVLLCSTASHPDDSTAGRNANGVANSVDRESGVARRPEAELRSPGTAAVCDESVRRFHLNGHPFELPAGYEPDHAVVVQRLRELAAHADLAEPFGRIFEAIREAQRIGGREREADGQAA
jgi:hypothetical protein